MGIIKSEHREKQGHLVAFFTIIIWGSAFISTKVLLNSFSPVEIMFFRFVIAYIVLLLLSPHRIPYKNIKEEIIFLALGVCGVTLYFVFSNVALTYTQASNVGVLTSTYPFFSAVLSYYFLKDEKINANFFAGFLISIIGIILISFNGKFLLKLNPIGDVLAILSAIVWAIYSILMRKISINNYNHIQLTRKIFFYGLITLVPLLFLFDFNPDLNRFASVENLFNILFLGVGASALCYVSWNFAVSILGTIKTSIYYYIIPIVTILTSVIILNEKITPVAMLGTLLVLIGLYISERKKTNQLFNRIKTRLSNIH
jgi:drug/metabolite transporter (DMT)-like permease